MQKWKFSGSHGDKAAYIDIANKCRSAVKK